MRSKPRRRMKYPPGARLLDPVGYAVESVQPVAMAGDGSWLNGIRMRNHSAVTDLIQGRGNRDMVKTLIAMHNMARQMLLDGFGIDLSEIILNSDEAIKTLVARVQRTGGYTLKSEETRAFSALLELHDAQLDVATTGDVTRSHRAAEMSFKQGNFTQLSTRFIEEPHEHHS